MVFSRAALTSLGKHDPSGQKQLQCKTIKSPLTVNSPTNEGKTTTASASKKTSPTISLSDGRRRCSLLIFECTDKLYPNRVVKNLAKRLKLITRIKDRYLCHSACPSIHPAIHLSIHPSILHIYVYFQTFPDFLEISNLGFCSLAHAGYLLTCCQVELNQISIKSG